jgi:hypothetical protein
MQKRGYKMKRNIFQYAESGMMKKPACYDLRVSDVASMIEKTHDPVELIGIAFNAGFEAGTRYQKSVYRKGAKNGK